MMSFEFILRNEPVYPVESMCECFGVSSSGYYTWRKRKPSLRSLTDEGYKERIGALYRRSKSRYGHRPIYHHLREEGLECGRDRTRRLMREMAIEGVQKSRYKPLGTDSRHDFGYRPNLFKEYGKPTSCNQIWVADTTYLQIDQGWCYLATVMDLFSRRIIGWSVSARNDTTSCCRALRSAVMTRGGHCAKGVIHLSDRGSTYASYDYQRLLTAQGLTSSMSAKGNCYDNAAMESFYGRFKTTETRDINFADEGRARSVVFEYIETFYNRFRKHSSLGYKTLSSSRKNFSPRGESSQAYRLASTTTKT